MSTIPDKALEQHMAVVGKTGSGKGLFRVSLSEG